MIFLISLILGIVGALPILFAKESGKMSSFVIAGACYVLFSWVCLYFGLPSLAYPLLGWVGFLLFILFAVSCIIASAIEDEFNLPSFLIALISIVLILGGVFVNSAMFRASAYANLIGEISDKTEKHWTQDTQQIDPTNVRLVPPSYALSMARTVVKDGSQFQLSEENMTLQKINGKNGLEYVYLIPLDYSGFSVWANTDFVPNYVKVNATDAYAKPQLLNAKLKYTPGACFGDNLERILYKKYPNKVFKDYSFESDDNYNLFFVVTVCHPTIGYNGLVVDGVIIVDPLTGEDGGIISKDKVPAWVDRVIPTELVINYINWWGEYKNGWLNSWYGKKGLKMAENSTVNYSFDNKCVFVIPVTSTNDNDHSMLSIMYVDTRTGKFTNYVLKDNGGTESAIIGAVDAKVSFKNMHASDQVVYENVYGVLTALVPVLGQKDNYEGLAIVETASKRVAFAETPSKALTLYQKILMERGGQIATNNSVELKKIKDVVYRLGWELSGTDKMYYLKFRKSPYTYQVNSDIASELCLTQEGDSIEVRYVDSKENVIPTNYFHNLTLNIKSTPVQEIVNSKLLKATDDKKNRLDANDIRSKVQDMSDEELLNKLKK